MHFSILNCENFTNMPVLEVTDASAISPSKRPRTETNPAEERPVLRFAKLSEHATTPTRGSAKAAGYDLYRWVILLIWLCFEFTDLMWAACINLSYHILFCRSSICSYRSWIYWINVATYESHVNIMPCVTANFDTLHWNSAYDYSIGPLDKAIVKTDIQIAVPHGCYGRVGECLTCWCKSCITSFARCIWIHAK